MTSRSESPAVRARDWFARASWKVRIGFFLFLGLTAKGFADLAEAGLLWPLLAVAIAAGLLAGGKSRRKPDGTRSDS